MDTRLARDAYISCASCHNDGGHDGRTWDLTGFGEGLRNTVNLRGRAGAQGALHWSNNFDEVQDFEGQIRNLAGGTGLMTNADFNAGTRSQPLGDAKAGPVSAISTRSRPTSASLNDLRVEPAAQLRAATLTAAATAGRGVFVAKDCAKLPRRHRVHEERGQTIPQDIGTLDADSGSRLGGPLAGIDVPTLRDVWATAPYLHRGSAATLGDAIGAHSGVSADRLPSSPTSSPMSRRSAARNPAPTGSTPGGRRTRAPGLLGRYFNNMTLAGEPGAGAHRAA